MEFIKSFKGGFDFEFFFGWFYRLSAIDTIAFFIVVLFCVIMYIRYGIIGRKKKKKKKKDSETSKEHEG